MFVLLHCCTSLGDTCTFASRQVLASGRNIDGIARDLSTLHELLGCQHTTMTSLYVLDNLRAGFEFRRCWTRRAMIRYDPAHDVASLAIYGVVLLYQYRTG